MPKSKREKVVTLAKTAGRTVDRAAKAAFITSLRAHVDAHTNLYVFSVANSRNAQLKALRATWKADSRFFFGRNALASVALGRSAADEYADNLHLVSRRLVGDVGLLFTNRPDADVRAFFATYVKPDFARTGAAATSRVALDAGPLPQFVASQEPALRALGLPVSLVRGVVTLMGDFVVCEAGDTLAAPRAKLLEMLGIAMADFRVDLLCHLATKDGKFTDLKA
ncbi:hypothetical protein BU14_3060s0001 [Porphyra umbilicalis]|uniref:Ribosome assembly factor mrt4 n=1 Tax=Porphyra umbilicalis TaxID=2786 RepID=A0A1X6NIL8_PORUM|nr:hypothetical protein BU14_3060s0001 [Porphyra umbilicalis]|eukprot:OSX68296.1 hypothetical protein BU14_3060s0001 [Porphyra umbilicalis]